MGIRLFWVCFLIAIPRPARPGRSAVAARVTPGTLTFSRKAPGTPSASQAIMLTNTGAPTLSIASLTGSGDFSQTNTCARGARRASRIYSA